MAVVPVRIKSPVEIKSGRNNRHTKLSPIPPFFSYASSGVCPTWQFGAPTTTIGGVVYPSGYNCNDKGSVVPEMLMDHLKFVNKVRAAKGRPDAWVMLLLDGVGTHVTAEMLEFFAINKLILGLRPPNTSHAVQNEDLVTFWCVVGIANI